MPPACARKQGTPSGQDGVTARRPRCARSIRTGAQENRLWGAPRVHGELVSRTGFVRALIAKRGSSRWTGDASLDEILEFLNDEQVHATYAAVAEVLGVIPRSLGVRLVRAGLKLPRS
jgi:hypothetical protein